MGPQPGWGVWSDGETDDKVTYIEQLIANNHCFAKYMWPGGDCLEPLYIVTTIPEEPSTSTRNTLFREKEKSRNPIPRKPHLKKSPRRNKGAHMALLTSGCKPKSLNWKSKSLYWMAELWLWKLPLSRLRKNLNAKGEGAELVLHSQCLLSRIVVGELFKQPSTLIIPIMIIMRLQTLPSQNNQVTISYAPPLSQPQHIPYSLILMFILSWFFANRMSRRRTTALWILNFLFSVNIGSTIIPLYEPISTILIPHCTTPLTTAPLTTAPTHLPTKHLSPASNTTTRPSPTYKITTPPNPNLLTKPHLLIPLLSTRLLTTPLLITSLLHTRHRLPNLLNTTLQI